jgi:hypothetical protein
MVEKINISPVPCRKMILQCLFQQLHNRRLASQFDIFLYRILVHVFKKTPKMGKKTSKYKGVASSSTMSYRRN